MELTQNLIDTINSIVDNDKFEIAGNEEGKIQLISKTLTITIEDTPLKENK